MEYKYKRLSTFASHEDRVGGLDNQVYTGLGGKLLVCSRVPRSEGRGVHLSIGCQQQSESLLLSLFPSSKVTDIDLSTDVTQTMYS